jgi:predicted RNase H-like HicB family nuclease
MKQKRQFTAIIEREADGYVSLCPELNIASQGQTVEESRINLIEALALFFETADRSEIESRLQREILVTSLQVSVGQFKGPVIA